MHQTAAWIDGIIGKGVKFISVQDDYKPFVFPDLEKAYKEHKSRERKTKASKRK